MADSYVFKKEDKYVKQISRKPLEEMPHYDLKPAIPHVLDALDTPDGYDIYFDKDWVTDLNPQQTLMVLKKVRNQLMREVNDLQKEIDRISLLELPYNDPRVNTPWPRYYELRARPERKPR